ncbi:MAG: glutamine amidotransferase [Actinomycetota bacterium]|nr:glutamine amidotransferase [Actinomycetota bacterium]
MSAGETAAGQPSTLRVVVVYPDLLGTYGDGGNGTVLARRAAWRGLAVELLHAPSDEPLPAGHLYCLGGGEDGPQVRAATLLGEDGALAGAVARGAAVLGVCAGFQLLGNTFPDARGRPQPGLGLLDVATHKGRRRRAVGEVVAEPLPEAPRLPVSLGGGGLPTLTGFENHAGVTRLGPGATPLARVVVGVGNGGGDGTEGAWSGTVVGSYLHGPLLARNAALADVLLGWALAAARGDGRPGDVPPLDDHEETALRAERLRAARSPGWRLRGALQRARGG